MKTSIYHRPATEVIPAAAALLDPLSKEGTKNVAGDDPTEHTSIDVENNTSVGDNMSPTNSTRLWEE